MPGLARDHQGSVPGQRIAPRLHICVGARWWRAIVRRHGSKTCEKRALFPWHTGEGGDA